MSIVNKWVETYRNEEFRFDALVCNKTWLPMIRHVIENDKDGKIKELEEFINSCINNDVTIYPRPDEVLNAFQLDLSNVKVVILGQDPYINEGQAMGLSFSVKQGITIPPSLVNIHSNLLKFGHIDKYPTHGDVTKWVHQGCVLLNTSLTVTAGMSNSHKSYWLCILPVL
jgi:uracil-DNA glycosylase